MKPSHPKLYLFDIDGTLIAPGPLPRRLLNAAVAEAAGRSPQLGYSDVAGFTDPAIVRNALKKLGIADGQVGELTATILAAYLERLGDQFPTSRESRVYDDALKLLERVTSRGYAVGLLTGNLRQAALIKLDRFGLSNRFPCGVYGDDVEDRGAMPWVARVRAREVYGIAFPWQDMILVGDTARDAQAAAQNGIRSLIVCRRQEYRDQILAARAGQVVDRLDDPAIRI